MEFKAKKVFPVWVLIMWGVFCAVFFTLPDVDPQYSISSLVLTISGDIPIGEIFVRIAIALGFASIFGGLYTYVTIKYKTIEWAFVIIATLTYCGMSALIVWFYAGRDFDTVIFRDLVYSMLISVPATLGLIELLEVIL